MLRPYLFHESIRVRPRTCTVVFAICGATLLSASVSARDPSQMQVARGQHAMVVTASPQATAVGVEMLRKGGSAVDAAIAVEFALAVTWPEAGNIGGGGFMLVHPPGEGEEVVCIDYREVAPRAATERMFTPDDGKHTQKIVGVPGTVHGMVTAHQRFGRLPWKALVTPAVTLAEEGFAIDPLLARSLNNVLSPNNASTEQPNRELQRVYGKPAGPEDGIDTRWKPGDRLYLPNLAKTLRRIADQGAAGFYQGETARLLVAEMQRGDGLISLEDLADYHAVVRPAVHGEYRGFDIFGPPPPSSGGICLVQMLNMLEPYALRDYDRFGTRNLHRMAETMKRVFRDRARFLGDSDFVPIPDYLTQKPYAHALAAEIDPEQATPSEQLASPLTIQDESPSTTHFSIVDEQAMAVANTTTLEASWGARIVVPGAGFVLNNEMGDFNWFPEHTDRTGRIGTPPNRIAAGKRMLSSQSPTIVARNGQPLLITGSPGGRTIINTTLQMVLNVVEFQMRLPDAMRAPRIHHQWLPDQISYEPLGDQKPGIAKPVVAELESMGHRLTALKNPQGSAHSIFIDPGTRTYWGVADWRRDGAAAGW